MRNLPERVAVVYGGLSIGAVVTMLNAWWTGPELEYGLTDSGAKIAVLDSERYARLAEHQRNCPALERVYVSCEEDEITDRLAASSKFVFMRKWDPVQAFKVIQRERVPHTGGVPTIAWQLIEHPERKNYDLSSLELITYGGAPAGPELVNRMKAAFPKVSLGMGWGMTETSGTG